MKHYAGLDLSMESTQVCIVEALLRKCPRDSVCKSSWLRGGDEQTAPRPLPHDKLEVL